MSDRVFLPDDVVRGQGVFIAPGAVVTGTVRLGDRSSVWYGAVLRGDVERIEVGEETNLQDGVIVHADEDYPSIIGRRVVVGHRAVIHGATVEDECLVGIGAILLNGVVIGKHSIVGAGAVVTERTRIPERSLVLGVPGKVVRTLPEQVAVRIRANAEVYVEAGALYRSGKRGG